MKKSRKSARAVTKKNSGLHLSEGKREQARPASDILTFLMMVYCHLSLLCGLVLVLRDIFDLTYSTGLHLIVSVLFIALLWYIYVYRTSKRFVFIASALALLSFLLYLPNIYNKVVLLQTELANDITLLPSIDMTEIMISVSIVLILITFFIFGILKKGWLLYLIIVPILFFGPYIGSRVSIMEIFFFANFFVGNTLLFSGKKKKTGLRTASAAQNLLTVYGILMLLFIACSILTKQHMDSLLRIPVDIEHRIVSVTKQIFKKKDYVRTQLNPGNNYPTNTDKLEVVLSELPSETIYLKNFTGQNYEGNSWSKANDSDYHEDQDLHHTSSYKSSSDERSYFGFLQYNLVKYAGYGNSEDDAHTALSISIHHLTDDYKGRFVPYFSSITVSAKNSYMYSAYTYADFMDATGADTDSGKWYHIAQYAYSEYVFSNYMSVPYERIPKLVQYLEIDPDDVNYLPYQLFYLANHSIESDGGENIDDTVAEIKSFLHDRTSYTLTPGVTPFWEDITDYFLFTNQKGYCQHYASSAALMLRLKGIPARYVSGFAASPSDFKASRNGTYHATLTDASAHAWVEIYTPYTGWIPVEFTPSVSPTDTSDSAGGMSSTDGDEMLSGTLMTLTPGGAFALVTAAAILFICLVVCRRVLLLGKQRRYTGDMIFERLVSQLHFCRLMMSYTGSEDDFSEALSLALPGITKEEGLSMQKAAISDIFGPDRLEPQRLELLRMQYSKISALLYERISIPKKLLYRLYYVFE